MAYGLLESEWVMHGGPESSKQCNFKKKKHMLIDKTQANIFHQFENTCTAFRKNAVNWEKKQPNTKKTSGGYVKGIFHNPPITEWLVVV